MLCLGCLGRETKQKYAHDHVSKPVTAPGGAKAGSFRVRLEQIQADAAPCDAVDQHTDSSVHHCDSVVGELCTDISQKPCDCPDAAAVLDTAQVVASSSGTSRQSSTDAQENVPGGNKRLQHIASTQSVASAASDQSATSSEVSRRGRRLGGKSLQQSDSFVKRIHAKGAKMKSTHMAEPAVCSNGKTYPHGGRFYKLQEQLGEGATATVWKATCMLNNEVVAVKIINLERTDTEMALYMKEARAMSALQHRHIIPLYAAFIEKEKLWMVQPFVDGGDLYEIMQHSFKEGLPDCWIATITRHCVEALQYLHGQGYVHRDIKAANLLLNHHGHIFVADFTVATQLERAFDAESLQVIKQEGFVGSIAWMAPEVVEGSGVDEKADVWALGMTILELAWGRHPWLDKPFNNVMMDILHGEPPVLPPGSRISNGCRDFVAKCLEKDPADRASAAELLKHQWIKHVASEAILGGKLVPHIPQGNSLKHLHSPAFPLYKKVIQARTDASARNASPGAVPKEGQGPGPASVSGDGGGGPASSGAARPARQATSHGRSTSIPPATGSVTEEPQSVFATAAATHGGFNMPRTPTAPSPNHSTPRCTLTQRLSQSLRLLSKRLSSPGVSSFDWDFSPALQPMKSKRTSPTSA